MGVVLIWELVVLKMVKDNEEINNLLGLYCGIREETGNRGRFTEFTRFFFQCFKKRIFNFFFSFGGDKCERQVAADSGSSEKLKN